MRRCLIFVFALAVVFSASGQVVSIHEYDSKNNQKLNIESPYIVGINSMLSINIDKDALRDSIAIALGGSPTLPSDMLAVVNFTLRHQQKALSAIAATGSRKDRLDALAQFRTAMEPIGDYLFNLPDSVRQKQFYVSLNSALAQGAGGYDAFFTVLNQLYDQVTSDYTKIVNESQATFSLGGFINTSDGYRQFHIDGFDSISSTGIYEVPRFATSIPQSEVDAFNAARNLADSLQSNADMLVDQMKSRALDALDQLEDKVDSIVQSGINSFENRVDSLSTSLRNEFTPPINTFKQSLSDYKVALVKLVSDLKNISFSEALTLVSEVEDLKNQTEGLITQADSLYSMVKSTVQEAGSIKQSLVLGLTTDITSVVDQLKELGVDYLDEFKNTIDLFNQNKLTDLASTAAKFSSSTYELKYSEVPEHADVDIRTTGTRQPGDQLYFKAVIRNSEGTVFNKTIFWQKYNMFHVGLHSSIRASLLFVDKVNGDFGNSTNDFQLAPSYSAIFKVGGRKSLFYNKYLTPGLGINVATIDFDNDNTPEIGVGVTAAFFQDYLQVGYGRNMTTNDYYWSFGLRIPLFGWAVTGVNSLPSATPVNSN